LDLLIALHWPDKYDMKYGEIIRMFDTTFQVDEPSTIRGFYQFKKLKKFSSGVSLKSLLVAINSTKISSFECERSISEKKKSF
jgi:hypothetical protein